MSRMGVCRAITAPFLLHAAQKQQIQSVTPFPITATLGVQKGSQSAALCGVTVLKQRRDFIICTSPFLRWLLVSPNNSSLERADGTQTTQCSQLGACRGRSPRAGRAHTAPRGCPDSSRAIGQQWGCRSPRVPALLTPRRDAAAVAAEQICARMVGLLLAVLRFPAVPPRGEDGCRRCHPGNASSLLSSPHLLSQPSRRAFRAPRSTLALPGLAVCFRPPARGTRLRHGSHGSIHAPQGRSARRAATRRPLVLQHRFGEVFLCKSTFGDVEPRGELESKAMPTQHPTNGAWGGRGGGGGGGVKRSIGTLWVRLCVCVFVSEVNKLE